ncbi:hypothetical protein AB1E18_011981 [Capra hircus]
MKEFNLRQVKAEQDRAARRAGVSRRKEQLPGRQRVERTRPLIPACPAKRGPHPGPPLPSRLLGPAPPPRPGRGATTAGRRRARATRRLTSPGCATPSMEERKRGRNNVGGERGERNGEAEAGARPEPGELLGRARGRGGWERGERLASVCGSSGTSAMVAEPLRGCCTDPPPTPRSGPAHLAVSRPAIGATWSDEQGGLANGRRRADCTANMEKKNYKNRKPEKKVSSRKKEGTQTQRRFRKARNVHNSMPVSTSGACSSLSHTQPANSTACCPKARGFLLGLSRSVWDLVPQPGIEPWPFVFRAQSLSHWTTREVSHLAFLIEKNPKGADHKSQNVRVLLNDRNSMRVTPEHTPTKTFQPTCQRAHGLQTDSKFLL